ncbi:unnamed protein product [Dovyalis caffra]|uniref:Uncharacterized protein n=1 Tax=Dovyalis caffra TaxID=77055 RepID=A0AAV1SMF9_9ROSI|nr:unnamed protein product [Dovyalis caffra]
MQEAVTKQQQKSWETSTHATDQSRRDSACSKESVRQVTKDVLTLSIREIRDTRKFVQSIPKLKSIQEKDSKELLDCVVGLIDCVSDIHSILNRMQHLKANLINSDTNSLRGMLSRVLGFNQICNLASKGVDGIIVTMWDRKLVDTVMLINNAVNVASKFQLETTATVNP